MDYTILPLDDDGRLSFVARVGNYRITTTIWDNEVLPYFGEYLDGVIMAIDEELEYMKSVDAAS